MTDSQEIGLGGAGSRAGAGEALAVALSGVMEEWPSVSPLEEALDFSRIVPWLAGLTEWEPLGF